jgi:toxin ParE1/3/4
MMRPILSPLAQKDLRSIWLYSAENWGRKQADRYAGSIRQDIARIAARPEIGNSDNVLRQGYAWRLTGSHIIFYRIIDGGVDIVRILHQSMDFDRHL